MGRVPDHTATTTRALADVDGLGGFFAIRTGPADSVDPSWRPLTALTGDVGADGPLARRVGEVAVQLGDAPRRVAASLLSLSLTARLVSLVLAPVALQGVLPRLDHARLHWRPWSGGPVPLWVEAPEGEVVGAPDDPATAARVADELARTHLAPLLEAVGRVASVPPRTLWGNAASSVGGAVRVLLMERPARAGAVLALGRGVVGTAPLDGLGGFVAEPSHPTGVGFLRRSCCLFYRVPGGGYCGDCVLTHR